MILNLFFFLLISTILFFIGLFGIILNRQNILIILISIELMLLAVNFNFICFSCFLDDLLGLIFALFVLTVAASESAIGLAILVSYYRVRGVLSINITNLLHG